jgi:hypothetical protein
MKLGFALLLATSLFSQETFHIAGTVINSQTGQPVKGALVSVVGMGRHGAGGSTPVPAITRREILTDIAGQFSADGLLDGTYSVHAQKTGFSIQPRRGSFGVLIGPSSDGNTLSLAPLSVITGHVTDGDGEPVPSASVLALMVQMLDGRRNCQPVRTVNADDQGRYRIWDLTPGDYYIATAGRVAGTASLLGAAGAEAFAPIYFPSAHDRASASPIALAPGQEFTADLHVDLEPSFRVRGTLRGAVSGQRVQVELLREAGDPNAMRAAANSADASFGFQDVVPGTYLLQATQLIGNKQIRGQRQVQVGNADLSGVVLDLLPGATISGVVHLPAPPPGQEANDTGPIPGRRRAGHGATAGVSLTSADWLSQFYNATADQQGEFAIEGVAEGRYRVTVNPFEGYVASAVSGTQDLLRGELLVGAGVAPARIEVEVRNDGGSVSVTTEGGDGWVVLAPVDGGDVHQMLALQGTSQFQNVAPGSYRVLWVKDIQTLEYRNPDVLRALRGGATVEVTGGASTQVELKEIAE